MTTELHRAFTSLGKSSAAGDDKQLPPYFLSYSVSDAEMVSIRAQYGALVDSSANRVRMADVQVRLGDPKLDNTHGDHRGSAVNSLELPLVDDRAGPGAHVVAGHQHRLQQRPGQLPARQDRSPGAGQRRGLFARLQPGSAADIASASRRRPWWSIAPHGKSGSPALSKIFREYPDVYQNIVMLTVQNETDYFASSEGSQVVTPHLQARLVVFAVTRADDGMDLFRAQTFEAETADGLPGQAELEAAIRELGKSLEALAQSAGDRAFRRAGDPVGTRRGGLLPRSARPPARRPAPARRRRRPDLHQGTGQGSAAEFLSVADDPTLTKFGNTWLSGSYDYDDEGQKARRVDLIQDGVLKTFLMSRLPIASFSASNGHGRAQTGRMPTGRQGNLIVTSTKTEPEAELRKQLIEEAKKQGKPYGLYFEDISSGFAVTTRSSPQAFR